MSHHKIVLFGIGNSLRRDDGAGPAVLDQLARSAIASQVELVPCHQLMPEMVETLRDATLVFFIDASLPVSDPETSCSPGKITIQPALPVAAAGSGITHHFGHESLLRMAQLLNGSSPPAFLATITATDLDYGEGFSPEVAASLPALARQVEEQILSELKRSPTTL